MTRIELVKVWEGHEMVAIVIADEDWIPAYRSFNERFAVVSREPEIAIVPESFVIA